ncbi:MAG: MerR family transcriptional regulator [Actinobacteria bacterium HGW-Actinobacteria-4]|nr:MAG: MerR family transcriptional regulator [Actinobacteria bacterium HGW-Actinobacteria-4]
MVSMEEEALISIGRFAALTKLSHKALRLYDHNGLLPAAYTDSASGYRYYTDDQRHRAALIGVMRKMEIPLATIEAILDTTTPEDAVSEFSAWWEHQQRAFAGRKGLAEYVTTRLSHEGTPTMKVHTRVVPERTFAFVSKEVYQAELDEFVMASFAKLFDHLTAHGLRPAHTSPEDPTYLIFHGQVTPDESAIVDVCVPFNGMVPPGVDIAIRLEPEHHEAYTPIAKRDAEYPQLLHAYDAVAEWVHAHGEPTLPAREVFVTDFMAAGPDDHVFDVAFPYQPR